MKTSKEIRDMIKDARKSGKNVYAQFRHWDNPVQIVTARKRFNHPTVWVHTVGGIDFRLYDEDVLYVK